MKDVPEAIEAMSTIESTRLIAAIARVTHEIGAAEEPAQDALVTALELRPEEGGTPGMPDKRLFRRGVVWLRPANSWIPDFCHRRDLVVPVPEAPRNPNVQEYLRLSSLPGTMPAAGTWGTCCRGQIARSDHEMALSIYRMPGAPKGTPRMSAGFWFRRYILVFLGAFALIAITQVIKGHAFKYSIVQGLIWAFISATVYIVALVYGFRNNRQCFIPGNDHEEPPPRITRKD